jgi:hypothetical protein
MMLVSLLSATVLMAGPITAEQAAPTTVAAAPATPAKVAGNTAAKSDKYGVVCRFEQVSGSRMGKKVCFIPAEYDAKRREDRQALERLQAFPRDGGG